MQIKKIYPSQLEQVTRICQDTVNVFREYYSQTLGNEKTNTFIQYVELMAGEAFCNAVRHAGGQGFGKYVIIHIKCQETQFEIIVKDQNPEFDFSRMPEPDFASVPEKGYGIYIIKKLADEVQYQRENNWNVLTIVKYIT